MTEFTDKSIGELGESNGNQYHSPEVARDAIEKLGRMAEELVLAQQGHSDVRRLRVEGATSTLKRFRHWWIAPEGVSEEQHREEMKKTGHTDMFSFTLTDRKGILVVKAAQLSGVSPEGNECHARLQLPRNSGAQEDGSSERRVVLDTWSTPRYERSCKQSGIGIPQNAFGITHLVYGRNEYIDQRTKENLGNIIDALDEAVASALRPY